MSGEGCSHLRNLRAGGRIGKIVCVRILEKVGRLGVGGYKEVAEGRGYAGALRDPYSGVAGGGKSVVVGQRLVLLLRGEEMSTEMSLPVW